MHGVHGWRHASRRACPSFQAQIAPTLSFTQAQSQNNIVRHLKTNVNNLLARIPVVGGRAAPGQQVPVCLTCMQIPCANRFADGVRTATETCSGSPFHCELVARESPQSLDIDDSARLKSWIYTSQERWTHCDAMMFRQVSARSMVGCELHFGRTCKAAQPAHRALYYHPDLSVQYIYREHTAYGAETSGSTRHNAKQTPVLHRHVNVPATHGVAAHLSNPGPYRTRNCFIGHTARRYAPHLQSVISVCGWCPCSS